MKLKHLEHVEDLVLLDDNGLDICKKYLTSALNTLYGIKSCDIQGKIDGSPSFVYGKHPTENTKIISTKSFFNKTPKYYSSISEIQECQHEDLRNKLEITYKSLYDIDNIFQGDILFTKDSLYMRTIDGIEHIIFTPNTITYAIESESEIGQKILDSVIGIAWHTSYSGDTVENLSANFTKFEIEDICNVFQFNTTFDVTKCIFYEDYEMMMNEIESIRFSGYDDSLKYMKQYINYTIKNAKNMSYDDYCEFFYAKDRSNDCVENREKIEEFFEFYYKVILVKQYIILQLERFSKFKTYINVCNELIKTKQEGYVVIIDGIPVKFVDRYDFSKVNFLMSKNRK